MTERLRILVFDAIGYVAHFRKHFTTTSSLSYTFPPRTTVCGMVAGILGYDRNTYYDKFSSEKCKIGLMIMKPVRRLVQTLNYLMTDEEAIGYLRKHGKWSAMPAQVRRELVMVDSTTLSQLQYRIFFHHEEDKIMEDLKLALSAKKFHYPPSMGTADNLATLEYVDEVEAEVYHPKNEVYIHTVAPASKVRLCPEKGLRIQIEELVQADFSEDRKVRRMENYFYEGNGKPIKVSVEGEVFKCKVRGEEVVGLFM